MTSGGTDVIEMPASAARSATGATVDAVVGDGALSEVVVEKAVVTTVVGASVEATEGGVKTCGPDELGVVALEAHVADRSTKATRYGAMSRKDCDLTALSPRGYGTAARC
jgi:hypothetical protein